MGNLFTGHISLPKSYRTYNNASFHLYNEKKNYIPFFTTRICFVPSQISECIVNSDANTATVSTQLPDNVASADVVIATAAGKWWSRLSCNKR